MANQGMQRSGGGAVYREINVNSRRPLIPTDYEVLGLQVAAATFLDFVFLHDKCSHWVPSSEPHVGRSPRRSAAERMATDMRGRRLAPVPLLVSFEGVVLRAEVTANLSRMVD